jgi:hypothetical protein
MDAAQTALYSVAAMEAYGASIWVRRRRRSEWDAAADSDVMMIPILDRRKCFL